MSYLFATPEEQQQMLAAIGVENLDDLFEQLPEDVRLNRELDLPPALSEIELDRMLRKISSDFATHGDRVCFQGGGAYDHFIPATVDEICSRGEFYTAYTPYQPEASQGTLQAFFEFQSLITALTGMDVANASLYEGASALAEAIIMAIRSTNRGSRVVISGTVHPEYIETVRTYLMRNECEIVIADAVDGVTDWQQAGSLINDQTAAVVVQHPNFFGCFEDVQSVVDQAHAAGALAIEVFDPVSLGVMKRPGDYGIDIAVAEGQSLGIPLQFGGPYLGIMACREKFVRKMPGRLIGQTVDRDGRRAFVLNFQTREQHIRRDKATSNICTNQGLMALRASVYISQLGPKGFVELGDQCHQKAAALADRLTEAGVGQLAYAQPFFKEFVFQFNRPVDEVIAAAQNAGFNLGPVLDRFEFPNGVPENSLLIAVTEKRTFDEIDRLVAALSR
ncbi:aminomethyl-transferring glycine dehydrogenase subunit GcvPA [Rubinisphaera margarita]|uniref:aminomethyl-transferring glycine dehydrogenase subunit GcvPA n=1 Tax=Rubinisphaera margarita TaxID=2909586 RepID=UPI001EE7F6C1|nr:aminomethyl-transferring glycine dehydrogenase subunit GcvPA [Rubinisphaera margarita]MCG6155145.1 aminomethyl-transferring glycine dehydrogenase subunit GcvPA [Rubinisphaera margarita]